MLFIKITSVMVVDKKEYSHKLKKLAFTEVSGTVYTLEVSTIFIWY